MLALVAFAVVASLASPLAAAQQPTLSIPNPSVGSNITPEVGAEDLDITFNYDLPSQGFNLAGAYQSFVPISTTFSCDQGISVEGPATVIVPIDSQQTTGGRHSHTEPFRISATKDAKGLTRSECTITAQAQAIQDLAVPESNQVNQKFQVTVDYYDSLSVNIPTPIQRAAPQREISFTLSITNFGNADTRLLFSIPEGGAPNEERYDWNSVLPTAQVVGTAIGGGNNVLDTTFTVSTPARTGWNNILDGYTIQISPQADILSSAKGTPVTASVLVRVRGVYVPGFEAVAMIGALLGGAVAIRRRGSDEE